MDEHVKEIPRSEQESTKIIIAALRKAGFISDLADNDLDGYKIENKLTQILDEITIYDFLQGLIADSDLMEVACCLDMIAQEACRRICVFDFGGRIYPALGVKLTFPCADPMEGE